MSQCPAADEFIGDWWFDSDDVVGLHFCTTRFTHPKIATQLNERGSRLLLYCRTMNGKLSCGVKHYIRRGDLKRIALDSGAPRLELPCLPGSQRAVTGL